MTSSPKRKAESASSVNGRGKSKKIKTTTTELPSEKRKKISISKQAQEPDSSSDESWDGIGATQGTGDARLSEEDETSPASADEAVKPSSSQGEPDIHPDRKANATSSRESHAKQKALVAERKAAKPHADLMERSKKLWERLRRKSHVPLEERKVLVKELFEILTGRVKDFVFKHDAVRVVQTGVKYANEEQRKMIARELKGNYRHLAESRYAKFLIGKLLVTGSKEIRDLIVPEFYGHVRRMIKHPEASWILDDVYRGIATRDQKAMLLREWYGAEFALFQDEKSPSADLAALLAKSPEKRTPIMRALHELLNLLIQKKLTGFTMLHDAMLQYFLNVQQGGEEMTDFIELIKGDEEGDLLKNLAFTRSGARLVCLALAHGTAKDRKVILRTYKDTLSALTYDTYGHAVILAAFEVIDDTVLVSKSIFPELIGKDEESQSANIQNALIDRNARIPLTFLFAGRAKSVLLESDLNILKEIDPIRASTSKKEPSVKRQELLRAFSPPILKYIATEAAALVNQPFGCQYITEALLGADGDRHEAVEAVAVLAEGDPKSAGHLAGTPAGGAMLKQLVLGGKFNFETKTIEVVEPLINFHNALYPHIAKHLVAWATSPSSFVIVNLLDAKGFSHREEAVAVLRKHRNVLEAAIRDETAGQKLGSAAIEDTETTNATVNKKRKRGDEIGKADHKPKLNTGIVKILEALK